MKKVCRISQKEFEITDEDQLFYKKMSPTFAEQVFAIPTPSLSPDERKRLRLSFRNLRNVYSRTCDKTGKKIMSYYTQDAPYIVYDRDVWWGDDWDGLDYGRDFDFSRPFFEQFEELFKAVPHVSRAGVMLENCDYVNGASKCKNCYLSFNMDYCEDCYYLTEGKHCRDCVDSFNLVNCELCYEGIDLDRCYNVYYSTRSTACRDSFFLMDCKQCNNCIGCVNLVGKEYYIFNEKVSQEEYEKYKENFKSRKFVQEFEEKFTAFSLKFPKKYYFGHSNENFSGNNLQNVKNSFECYNVFNLENCKYCYFTFNARNCMDYDIFGDNSEWIYNCVTTGINCSNVMFSFHNWNSSSNNIYCFSMSGSSNNFGCASLKGKQYCILNKQYSKEEYGKMLARIIEHMQKTSEWGEFFPASMSPFAYNETQANEIFTLTKEEALARGYRWKDEPVIVPIENPVLVPDRIDQIEESIVNQVLTCTESGKSYKIMAQEYQFYKKLDIPAPSLAPEIRHSKRSAKILPQHLWERECAKKGEKILTSYSPDRPEIIYCEKCYLEEVY